MTESVIVRLSQEEALILHAWLARNTDTLPVEDQAEQRVLWDLEASLEKQVASLFSESYDDHLARAWDAIRDATD